MSYRAFLIGLCVVISGFFTVPALAACGAEVYPAAKEKTFFENSAQAIEDVQGVVDGLLNHEIVTAGQVQTFRAARDNWRSGFTDYQLAFQRYDGELQLVLKTTGEDQINHCEMASNESKRFMTARDVLQTYTNTMIATLRDMRARKTHSNDPLSSQQYYLKMLGRDSVVFSAPLEPVIVAVIDDGVYVNHEDLRSHIWVNPKELIGNGVDDDHNGYVDDVYGYDFLSNNSEVSVRGAHGTHVAGVVAAVQDNAIGIQGVAPNARIMSLIACDSKGLCNSSDITRAIRYAVDNGAKIINLSLSSSGTTNFSTEYNSAIRYAYEHGTLIVAAAGNGDKEGSVGEDLNLIPQSPVCNNNDQNMVLGVGAINDFGLRTIWSNFGTNCVDVYAPGDDILSTAVPNLENGQAYSSMDGTSFSAPMITGIAAILKGMHPEMNPKELLEHLKVSSWQQIASLSNAMRTSYIPYQIVINPIGDMSANVPSSTIHITPPPTSVAPPGNLVCSNHEQMNQRTHTCACVNGYIRDTETHLCRKDIYIGVPKKKSDYLRCEVIVIRAKRIWYPKGHKKLKNSYYRSMTCYATSQIAERWGYRKGK